MPTETLSFADALGAFAPGQPLRAVLVLTYCFDGRWFEEALARSFSSVQWSPHCFCGTSTHSFQRLPVSDTTEPTLRTAEGSFTPSWPSSLRKTGRGLSWAVQT